MEHARHRLPGALRLLQSFPGHLDNELVAACSPLDSRDGPDVILALVLQMLKNHAELAGDFELVIGVNRILATWTSRSSAVIKSAPRTRSRLRHLEHATARSKCS